MSNESIFVAKHANALADSRPLRCQKKDSAMTYSITGLPIEPFLPLIGLSERELTARHIVRVTADAPSKYPCRVLLEDAKPGDTLLLLNHEYQPAQSPYKGRHAIFVNESATAPRTFTDEIPTVLFARKTISLRVFDLDDMMIDADLISGADVDAAVRRLLTNPNASYLHAHNADRGCFAARIDRN
jgi:hypothetical protein